MYDKYESDLKVVEVELQKKYPNGGYQVRPGNECVWVSQGRTEQYWIVRDGKVADVIFD